MTELTPKQMARAEELALQSYSKENVFQYDSFIEGYAAAISDRNKNVEVLIEALEWNAYTICLDDIYKHENNEQNKINLLCNIREAKEALAKFRREE